MKKQLIPFFLGVGVTIAILTSLGFVNKAFESKIKGISDDWEVVPLVVAESNEVSAGTFYESSVYLTIRPKNSNLDYKITSTVGAVFMDELTKVGKIKFKAAGGRYDINGTLEKKYSYSISARGEKNDFVTFSGEFPYTVIKPKVYISGTLSMYEACSNNYFIESTDLKETFKPTYRTQGGQVIVGANKNFVNIIPALTSKSISLSISIDGTQLTTETFAVHTVPTPQIIFEMNNESINLKMGAEISSLSNKISTKVIPDDAFKAMYPAEANYQITKWSVTLVRGRKPAMPTILFTGSEADIASIKPNLKSGDRLVLEILELERTNSLGEKISEKLPKLSTVSLSLN